VITGAPVALTVIVPCTDAWLPWESWAVHFTVVAPIGKVMPDA